MKHEGTLDKASHLQTVNSVEQQPDKGQESLCHYGPLQFVVRAYHAHVHIKIIVILCKRSHEPGKI